MCVRLGPQRARKSRRELSGGACTVTGLLPVLPYLLLNRLYLSLGLMILVAMLIISLFYFCCAVGKDRSFWKRFGEMAGISLGIAAPFRP
jgi:vacuolar iron transporter family protein